MSDPAEPPEAVLPETLRAPGRDGRADRADYERYFRIVRSRPDLLEWTRTCLRVQDQVLGDLAASGLGPREQQRVRDGIALLNRGTLADWAGHTSDQQSGPYAGEAMHRWKLGHQLFHLQLARMCALLDQALDAVENRRWPTLTSLLDTLAELYDAATATMSYTAALPAGAYRDEVRPSMAPPARPGGFSGVLNAEHRAMIGLLRALRRALDAVPGPATDPAAEALREAAGRLAAAHRRNLDNHVLICGRFVPDGVSLLRKHLAVEAPEDTR